MFIGMFIGLLLIGFCISFNNRHSHAMVEVAVARAYIRVFGSILIFASAGALIGTFLID